MTGLNPPADPSTPKPRRTVTPGTERTRWRGLLHAWMTPAAIVLGILLVLLAEGTTGEWTAAVFALSSILLFGTSALYHRGHWGPLRGTLLRRADHANIFLLIAGTYTPTAAMVLPRNQAVLVLSIIWAGALCGALLRILWPAAPRWLSVGLYILLGWGAVMYLPAFYAASPAMMILIVLGGLFYTVGAVFYATKRPNPLPGVFGFHEIFHACTIIAYLCHWWAVLLVVG